MLDKESFDDRAPVRSCRTSSSPGEKSKLGTEDLLKVGVGSSAGFALAVDVEEAWGGGGGGGGVCFVGGGCLLGGLEARPRADW